jgi:hypothetical protein
LLYASIRFVEAYGLWHELAWSEWFGAISGSIYLPIEVYELVLGITAVKVILFLGNLAHCRLSRPYALSRSTGQESKLTVLSFGVIAPRFPIWRRAFHVETSSLRLPVGGHAVLAQEGHPLTGTWTGDWGSTNAPRTHLTLVLNWDGDEKIAGVINPGLTLSPFKHCDQFHKLDRAHRSRDKRCCRKAVRVQAEGKVEDLGSPRRKLSAPGVRELCMGDFKVTRAQ